MTIEDLNNFKSNIKTLAVKERWRPAQIQYAEDFIDAMFKGGPNVIPPFLLDTAKRTLIRDRFRLWKWARLTPNPAGHTAAPPR